MPQTWVNALSHYSYPVDLADYQNAKRFSPYFTDSIPGDRDSTIQFENYFRTNANKIEPWFEVVFWKLYSQPRISNQKTEDIIRQLKQYPEIKPTQLIEQVNAFMNTESRQDFDAFRKLFRFKNKVIAVCATFPAFLQPNRFPMVDTRVAKWVNMHYKIFNTAHPDRPQLIPSEYGYNDSLTVLTMDDFTFYLHWIHWTRFMAAKLTRATGQSWRARDVEMSVFTAWGDRGNAHPLINLTPITEESVYHG